MVRHLLTRGVEAIHILSRDEAKQDDMRRWLGDSRAQFFVGDVRDTDSVARAMGGADFVFHAAALKQVPSCEFFPQQAVQDERRRAATTSSRPRRQRGVQSVVCLSTDKAVYPINAMGMSKALMEKTAQAFARNHPDSRDHGVGHPLRQRDVLPWLGDPAVRRADPSRAAADGHRPEDDPVPDVAGGVGGPRRARLPPRPAGRPLRAQGAGLHHRDLARAVASLLGDDDPEITVIGTRHGEKLHETLLSREETA